MDRPGQNLQYNKGINCEAFMNTINKTNMPVNNVNLVGARSV